MSHRIFGLLAALAALAAVIASSASAQTGSAPQRIDDATLQALSTTIGGADPLPSSRHDSALVGIVARPE
jgi:hypothetical protein